MSFAFNCLRKVGDELECFGIFIYGGSTPNHFEGVFQKSPWDSNVIEIDVLTDMVRIYTPWTDNYYYCPDMDINDIIYKLQNYEIPRAFVLELFLLYGSCSENIEDFCHSLYRMKEFIPRRLIVRDEEEIDKLEDFRLAANDWYKKEALSDIYIPEPEYSFVWEV